MQAKETTATFSCFAIGLGALALAMALIHVFAGPFAPTQSLDVTIGEFAANVRAAAQRALAGEAQPAPVAAAWDIDRILRAALPAAGVLSVLLAVVGLLRQEPKRAALCGLALGTGAILAQVLLWVAMAICAAIIIAAIIDNIGDVLGSFGA
jgi:hypothetical protein